MPKIPTYMATGKSTPEEYPRDVPTEDFSNLGAAQPALGKIGNEVAQIVDYKNVVDQKNEQLRAKLETGNLKGAYTATVKDTLDVMKTDPNIKSPDDALLAFNKAEQQVRADVMKRAQSPITKFNLDLHINDTLAENRENAKHIGRQNAVNYNVGLYETNQDRLVNLAVSDPANAAQYRAEASASTDEMRKNNYINDIRQGKDKLTFRDKMFEQQADVMMSGPGGSPEMFRVAVNAGKFGGIDPDTGKWDENGMTAIDMTKKLIQADGIDAKKFADEERVHAKMKAINIAEWDRDARLGPNGPLTDAKIQNALDGKDPYVLPKEAEKFKEIKLSPPDPRLDLAVKNLAQEYRSDTTTVDRVNTFRRRASALGVDRYNKEFSNFMNELQSDESTARALGNQQMNQAIGRSKADAKDTLKQDVTGLMPKIDAVIKNMDAKDLAEVDRARRATKDSGGNPEQVETAAREKVAEIMKRRKEEADKITPAKKSRRQLY